MRSLCVALRWVMKSYQHAWEAGMTAPRETLIRLALGEDDALSC